MLFIARFNGLIYQAITKNIFFGFAILMSGIFLSMLKEKIVKEKWALLDSFRRSERILEKIIENSSGCIFILD